MIRINLADSSPEEFKKAKEYLKGHLALSLEDSEGLSSFYGYEELILGQTREIKDVYRSIDQVKIEDVVKLAKRFFRPERLNLALIGPFKSETKFVKLLL